MADEDLVILEHSVSVQRQQVTEGIHQVLLSGDVIEAVIWCHFHQVIFEHREGFSDVLPLYQSVDVEVSSFLYIVADRAVVVDDLLVVTTLKCEKLQNI